MLRLLQITFRNTFDVSSKFLHLFISNRLNKGSVLILVINLATWLSNPSPEFEKKATKIPKKVVFWHLGMDYFWHQASQRYFTYKMGAKSQSWLVFLLKNQQATLG